MHLLHCQGKNQKKSSEKISPDNGAQEGTRTPTPLTEPAPEAGASTNFATWATGHILKYFPSDVKDKICFVRIGKTLTNDQIN